MFELRQRKFRIHALRPKPECHNVKTLLCDDLAYDWDDSHLKADFGWKESFLNVRDFSTQKGRQWEAGKG